MRKLTTEIFISRAQVIHNNKFNYDLVNYISYKYKVKIICFKHGVFEQNPFDHLSGKGCRFCCKTIKKTTKDFIEKANQIHNNKYEYFKTKYVNSKSKVIITCLEHGDFEQRPELHLYGRGCSKCSKNCKRNTFSFIKEANKIHDFKYDYSKVEYINAKEKVIIICPEHGEFEQVAHSHLMGMEGCSKCSGKYIRNTEDFIKQSHKIHNHKYDYSIVKYINTKIPIHIICPKHGKFKQVPNYHLSGCGCPKCSHIISKQEMEIENILKENNITFNSQIKIGKYKVDFLINKDVVLEFYGDYWHANPEKFSFNWFNNKTKKFAYEIWERDKIRKNILMNKKFKFIIIWENDWNNRTKEEKENFIRNIII